MVKWLLARGTAQPLMEEQKQQRDLNTLRGEAAGYVWRLHWAPGADHWLLVRLVSASNNRTERNFGLSGRC
jgi:hypothetical protein